MPYVWKKNPGDSDWHLEWETPPYKDGFSSNNNNGDDFWKNTARDAVGIGAIVLILIGLYHFVIKHPWISLIIFIIGLILYYVCGQSTP